MTNRQMTRRLGLSFFIYALSVFAGRLITVPVMDAVFPDANELGWLSMLLSAIPVYLIGVPVFYFFTRNIPDSPPEPGEPFRAGAVVRYAAMGFAVAGVFSLIGNLLHRPFVNRFDLPENLVEELLTGVEPLAIIVFLVLLAPIMEELMFRRRYLTKALQFGKRNAVLAGGIAFGLAHQNLPQSTYATALGIYWGILYVRHRSLLLVIILHMIVNLTGSVLTMYILRQNLPVMVLAFLFLLVVFISGLVMLYRQRHELAAVLREEPAHTSQEIDGDPSGTPDAAVIDEKSPSLMKNGGYIAYVIFSACMIALPMVISSYL